MAAFTPDELLRLWAQENLPIEMAIGQVLQNLVYQQSTILALQSTLADLRVIMKTEALTQMRDNSSSPHRKRKS